MSQPLPDDSWEPSTIDPEYAEILHGLIHRIRSAKIAFAVPIGDSRLSDDRDYLEEVGRMAIEELNKVAEV